MTHFPRLDLALESGRVYYSYVIADLRKQKVTNYPDDLGAYGKDFAAQAKVIGEKALGATKDVKERVY